MKDIGVNLFSEDQLQEVNGTELTSFDTTKSDQDKASFTKAKAQARSCEICISVFILSHYITTPCQISKLPLGLFAHFLLNRQCKS